MEHNDPEDAAKAMTALERQKRLAEQTPAEGLPYVPETDHE
jgi:hypothetical protein